MLDPGALGTLIIGLRANGWELDFESDGDHWQPPTNDRLRRSLHVVARSLRRLADRLEPAPRETEPAAVR